MSFFVDFWQLHFPILSILLPAFTGFALILLGNPGSGSLKTDPRQPLRHAISLGSAVIGLILALCMVDFANTGQIKAYFLSEWSAPFGIALVVDRLSAMMVLLTYIVALPVLWFASAEWDQRGRYFHAMFHFLLMGVSGAFLTGDLFNLFVFFEVLLLASYVLLLHHHNKARFKLGLHYVIINLLASAMFLIGLGLIYGNVGSLNMADVARLFPRLDSDQHQLAMAGAMLLFVVFGIKAAMLPVGFWLPKTYAVAATPVAAIFALMSKVGIYAILRVNGTVFSDPQGQYLLENWLLIIGVLTSIYGASSVLIAVSLFSTQAWAAGLYYLIHSTVIAATFYLLGEWISIQRGAHKDHLKTAPEMKQHKLLSLLFLVVALMMAGLPPFSGFIGKVFLMQGTLYHPQKVWIILVVLLVSLLSILAFVRAGYVIFWRASTPESNPKEEAYALYQALPDRPNRRLDIVIYALLIGLTGYALLAQPVYQYTYAAAEQLQNKQHYQAVLLKNNNRGDVVSTQPFNPYYLPHLKYREDTIDDPYAKYIPFVISPKTLAGEHIPEELKTAPEISTEVPALPDDDAKLVPVE